MNKELQDYYENRFSMMATKGWNDLMEDIDIMISSTDTIKGIDDEKLLQFRKGELSIMNWLRNLREASGAVYDQLQEEDKLNA